jgi:hypothetical protein
VKAISLDTHESPWELWVASPLQSLVLKERNPATLPVEQTGVIAGTNLSIFQEDTLKQSLYDQEHQKPAISSKLSYNNRTSTDSFHGPTG